MDRVVAEIYETTEYDKFKFLTSNREVSERRKAKIRSSIESIKYIIGEPIVVNERMEIIDGQARFCVCQELGIPVYYVVVPGAGEREIGTLNSASTNWSITDYIDHYATMGVSSYIYLSDLLEKYPSIGIKTIISITKDTVNATGSNANKRIKSGEYEIDVQKSQEIEDTLDFLANVGPYVRNFEGPADYMFLALAWCFRHTAANREHLADAVRKSAVDKNGRARSIASVAQSLAIIEDQYNLGLRKGRIYFTTEYKEYNAANIASYRARWGEKKS